MASVLLMVLWTVSSIGILCAAFMLTWYSRVSQTFEDLVVYGKLHKKTRQWSLVQLAEVPKRCFIHFYLLGSIINISLLLLATSCYVSCRPFPSIIQLTIHLLNYGTTEHDSNIDSLSAVLLLSLMSVQTVRRLIECLFVSVYSPQGTMNILHYLLGIVFYSTFPFTVLTEAPMPNNISFESVLSEFHCLQFAGVVLFVWSSCQQNRINVTFAKLRTNNKGAVVNYDHSIPRGGWFEYVSCPHYLMEIIIYLSFLLIGRCRHVTLFTVVMFVISNQLTAGCLTHRWYQKRFSASYPAQRTAVIPFLL